MNIQKDLIESQWMAMHGQSFPKQRFFTPLSIFWSTLESLQHQFSMSLIDCGTGDGDLPNEAQEYGIKMGGVDIIHRTGNSPLQVQIVPAHMIPYSHSMWPMACRPDHSGWCIFLQTQARNQGAGFIYVGLMENIHRDLDMTFGPDMIIPDAGEEDETMYVWYPEGIQS